MALAKVEIEQILLESVGKAMGRDPQTLTTDMRWQEDLGFKSVQGMKVCGLLNYKLKVTVPLGGLVACATLDDAVDMLDALVNT